MPQRVFIIHGWGGSPEDDWVPWLTRELAEAGITVSAPTMPNTDEPVIDEWVDHLAKTVGELDEHTYFVGHSIGCQAIMRYLVTQAGKRAGGVVCVAGWLKLKDLEDEEVPIGESWLQTEIDFDTLRTVTKKFFVLNSSNDPYNCVEENKRLFEENVGATVTILKERGHFTAADGATELPEALQAIKDLAKI